jgi:L-alanine-DL-glutamate epimerase-like enolase superfamily enzyme
VSERFTLSPFEFFVLHTRTRFPFRYGIASMTDVPHLFARTRVTLGARSSYGVAAEGLPPKWFTKNPATTFEQDLPEMFEVIRHATGLAEQIAHAPVAFFDFWHALDRAQRDWSDLRDLAPLLTNLGVSLVERAVLDALCRLVGQPLHRIMGIDALKIRVGEVYPELGAASPRDLLPDVPLAACFVRHTVGLGDPIAASDINPVDRVDDGLPQDLETSIRAYGLRYFKVKLSGDLARDVPRLRELSRVLVRETAGDFFVTLDGNENFHDLGAFHDFWQQMASDVAAGELWRRIIMIEQPVHRDRALDDDTGRVLRAWHTHPPLIIDESDGAVGDLVRALELGYAGTSHKNCKGIVKGIANACLLAKRRNDGRPGVLSGEDLCNLGPVALLQDLAMMALLGIEHVERNGHHYYRGLSMFPATWQEAALADHDDLYTRHPDGFARLRITEGKLHLASANEAPFGVHPLLDPSNVAVPAPAPAA